MDRLPREGYGFPVHYVQRPNLFPVLRTKKPKTKNTLLIRNTEKKSASEELGGNIFDKDPNGL